MASLFSSRLTSAYTALQGARGAPQTPTETIDKLVDRIQTGEQVEDRRTAVLGLKGCTREYKEQVGNRALPSLIAVLQHDAPYDPEIAKAVLETLMQLMEVGEKPAKDDPGLRFMDQFFATPEPTHSLLSLLHISPSFYPRFYTLQLLSSLLLHRTPVVQAYLISAPPPGVDGILAVLDPHTPPPASGNPAAPIATGMSGGAGEMLRNEALLLLPALIAGNADLQKIVAFSGAFEKLLDIVQREGGVEGGIIVQDVLVAIGSLLRYNVSNQNYFKELSLIPQIPPMLFFPSPPPAISAPAPDDFALQYWPEQKLINAGLVLGLIRMLVGGPGGGNQSAMVSSGITRCLFELALASNAPSALKAQALNTLTPILLASPQNQAIFSSLALSPLVPVPANEEHPNGGFVRLEMRPGVVALIESVVEGEGDPTTSGRGLRGRAAGVNMFEAYVTGNEDARLGILSTMAAAPPAGGLNADQSQNSAGSILLSALVETPLPGRPFDPYRPLFACLLLSHLLRNSEQAKTLAREISLPPVGAEDNGSALEDDDAEREGLVQVIVGNLLMASREQTEVANRRAKEGVVAIQVGEQSSEEEEANWNRVMVGYLVLLCTWLWDSPKTVREFLNESSNLQVLTNPITQPTGVDALVQGLSAFLLGVCYEFNREPGEVTRSTLHPILHSRIGPDQFVSRMARLREDVRFKAVQPDQFDVESKNPGDVAPETEDEDGLELWFDWAFVDFWKNNYYTIQRSIAIEPDAVRGTLADDSEAARVIASLRDKLKAQSTEIEGLHSKLSSTAKEFESERQTLVAEIESLSQQMAELSKQLQQLQGDHAEAKGATEGAAAEHQTALKSLEDQRAGERAEHEAALAAVQEQLSSLRTEQEATLEQHKQELDALRTEHEKALTAAKSAGSDDAASGAAAQQALEAERDAQASAAKKALADLQAEKSKREETEKEHEDLLVLLEELSQKRKKDKQRMKEKGMDVSEGEDDDDDGDDDDEADEE